MFREIHREYVAPKGFTASGIYCGIKTSGKSDLALFFSEKPCHVAGMFTTNLVKAAPVLVTKERVAKGRAQAIIVNSGNANCCTGKTGENDALRMTQITAKHLNIPEELVLVSSTGTIGRYLPMLDIESGIPELVESMSRKGFAQAAEAILTTDLMAKHAAVIADLEGKNYRISVFAKGSGMISPKMATMLVFILTDAVISRSFMKKALKEAVENSFNRITVDGDMSTNDTVLLLANGYAGNLEINEKKGGKEFQDALTWLCRETARKIVVDGEGATKFVSINVEKAASEKDAEAVARTIAQSPLVKTAIFGENPNWGRIISSCGASGARFDPEKVTIFINGLQVVKAGHRADYNQNEANEVMRAREINIRVNLSAGNVEHEIWTCDFSHGYVDINV